MWTRSIPVLIATAPSPHRLTWSITYESISQRLANQCLETNPPSSHSPPPSTLPRALTRRMGLFGHTRIHDGGIGGSLGTPSTSCTSAMLSLTHTPPPSAATVISPATLSKSCTLTMPSPTHTSSLGASIINSSTTATISEIYTDTADFSCSH
ncbi:hypothetical protein SprV_0902740100 [Sparganum proliferum]